MKAFTLPLMTTAIAAQNAKTLKRGTASARWAGVSSATAKTPPTQRASAIT